jgi:ERF superfamily.
MPTQPKAASEAPEATPQPLPIAALLASVSAEVGAVRKSSTAPGAIGGFQFRGVDAVVNAVHPVLARHGVVVVPEVLDTTFRTFQSGRDREMADVTVRTRFTFYGPAGDSISCTVLGEGSDVGDKATGKAQSVALRIALLQTLMLPTDEPDPDESNEPRTRDLGSTREQPAGPPARPAHQRPFWDALAALSASQQKWVRDNWPSETQPAQMNVEDTAKAVEWMAANVPPA